MALNYDSNDLMVTSRGGFIIGHDGDLLDTLSDPLRSLFQEIRTRVMSSIGDWSIYPSLGASIEDFIGEPNNKLTAESIKIRIISSLTKNGFINSADLMVKYTPVDINRILFRVSVKVAPTSLNGNSTTLTISALYNYSENNVFVTH